MEILKGFVFDIQRFATMTAGTWYFGTGVTSDTAFIVDLDNATGTRPTDDKYYLKAEVAAGGTTWSIVQCGTTADTEQTSWTSTVTIGTSKAKYADMPDVNTFKNSMTVSCAILGDDQSATGMSSTSSLTFALSADDKYASVGGTKYKNKAGKADNVVFTGTKLTTAAGVEIGDTGYAATAGGISVSDGTAVVTVALGAATGVTEFSSGAKLTGVAAAIPVNTAGGLAQNGSVTVNGVKYINTTTKAAGNIAIEGATGNSSVLVDGTVQITATEAAASSVTAKYDGVVASVSSGTANVIADAANTNATYVDELAADGNVKVSQQGIVVKSVADLATGTNNATSGSVTVNGVTYVAGRATATQTSLGALNKLEFTTLTETTGAVLTNGTVYLDGTTNKEVRVETSVALQPAVVTALNGSDISVVVNGAGAKTSFDVHDLDNGDAFTVTAAGKTYTYQVVNGELMKDGTSVGGKAILSSDAEGTISLKGTVTFATGAITAGADRETNVYASTGDAVGTTSTISLTLTDSSAVTHNITKFYDGATNYVSSAYTVSTVSGSGDMGTITYDSSNEVYVYTASSSKQTITANDAAHTWNIIGSSEADSIKAVAGAKGTISAGSGNDTIWSSSEDVVLNGGDGKDIFDISNATTDKANIADFNWQDDVVMVKGATTAGNFALSDGKIDDTANGGGVASISAARDNLYLAQLQKTGTTTKQYYAWVKSDGATNIDASGMSAGIFADMSKNNADELGDSFTGSAKADVVYAGINDTVDAGAGDDVINITNSATAGAKVQVNFGKNTGKDTVNNWRAGFDAETADRLYATSGNSKDISVALTGSTLRVKNGTSSYVDLNMVGTTGFSNGQYANVLLGEQKITAIAAGTTYKVADADTIADYYMGSDKNNLSNVDYSALDDDVTVWFAQNAEDPKFRNIGKVVGGKGNSTLMAGEGKQTLQSTAGNTTLYGGAGNDFLIGNAASNDVFAVFAGDGSDTISGFQSYNADADTNDYLWFNEGVSAKRNSSGNAVFTTESGAKATVVDTNVDTKFVYKSGDSVNVAKVGKSGTSMSYEKDVTVYVGSGSDTVAVASTDDAVNIWMDGTNGSALYGGVKFVNGSAAKGDLVIAGNADVSQSLIGGQGNTYLWGGTGSGNDTLKGGSGTTGYLFGKGEGNDVVQSYKAGDTVWMYNMTVDDLASAEIDTSKNTITLTTKAGNSLTVKDINTNSTDFALNFSDGRNFVASKGQWKDA